MSTHSALPRVPAGVCEGSGFAARAHVEAGTSWVPKPRWPPVDWEDLTWRSNLPPDVLSRSLREQLALPYRASITPEIAGLEVRLPRATAATAEAASVLIRDFEAEVGAELTPFAAILLRSESASSSQIENLTSDAKQIALAELGEDARRNASQVVGNVRAMQAAVDLSQMVDSDSILAMHRALLERTEPEIGGRWRTEQVWIGGGQYSPHNASFVPPRAERIAAAIDDLVAFTDREDIPALAHAAIAHAQF